ncbi:hypothetical protein BC829DRAFT_182838 [Chytridium lagenaria]|nr:hypothetical protein BC829DRAFT_182838 [Chytridium lagenaria]
MREGIQISQSRTGLPHKGLKNRYNEKEFQSRTESAMDIDEILTVNHTTPNVFIKQSILRIPSPTKPAEPSPIGARDDYPRSGPPMRGGKSVNSIYKPQRNLSHMIAVKPVRPFTPSTTLLQCPTPSPPNTSAPLSVAHRPHAWRRGFSRAGNSLFTCGLMGIRGMRSILRHIGVFFIKGFKSGRSSRIREGT